MGIERKDELVRYYYDKADQLVKTNFEGEVKTYTYDKAGNLLSDGESTYTYDLQNRLVTKTNADGTTTYSYDKAGNLTREIAPDGITNYTYSAQSKLVKGEKTNGESSTYVYNALGVRIANTQVRTNKNAGNQNADLRDGSHGTDYLRFLKDGRSDWQRVWETEIGTTVQSDKETVTRHYTVDYLSIANRDIFVTEDGSYTTRYVYDASGRRLSAEFDYAEGTKRGETGENLQSDIAVSIGKVFYRTSILGSTLFAVDKNGEVIAHAIYDPWGKPLTETYTDSNYSGLENLNNFTGYTWDITLALYFAQNRFYDANTHRFTQEDTAKDGNNWYVYCGNEPILRVDEWGNASYKEGTMADAPTFTFDKGFVYDPNEKATLQDYLIWWKWGILLAGAPLKSLNDAAKMYNHYRSALGGSVRIDLRRAYEEDSIYHYYIDKEIETMKNAVEDILKTKEQQRIEIIGNLQGVPNGSNENWQKTIGAFYMYGHGIALINYRTKKAAMDITFYMEDMYNFNPGQYDIATGTPDSENGRFAVLGWAKEFKTYGEVSFHINWLIGESSYNSQLVCGTER